MKLSEAIREGSRLSLQAFGTMNKGSGACALGAAVEHLAMRGEIPMEYGLCSTWNTDPLEKRFPAMLSNVPPPCKCEPLEGYMHHVSCKYDGTLMLAIIHLNDEHAWSREAIAEWVEVIENKLEAEANAKVQTVPVLPTKGEVAGGEEGADVRPVLRPVAAE